MFKLLWGFSRLANPRGDQQISAVSSCRSQLVLDILYPPRGLSLPFFKFDIVLAAELT